LPACHGVSGNLPRTGLHDEASLLLILLTSLPSYLTLLAAQSEYLGRQATLKRAKKRSVRASCGTSPG